MNAEKFMTLLYISDEMQAKYPRVLLHIEKWEPDLFYIVRQLPLIEMLHQDPVELAEEIVGMTNESDWRAQNRRPVGVGDLICCGLHVWMYAHTELVKEINRSITAPLTSRPLSSWPEYTIINLPISIDSVKEMLCKLST